VRSTRLGLAALAFLASGCGVRYEPPLAPLPTLPVAEPPVVERPPAPRFSASPDPWRGLPLGPPVTLRAVDVDARALVLALAEAAEVNLILEPGAAGRVSVNLVEIPALEALRHVLAAADLSVVTPPPGPLFEPVVFYVLPVDIERADVQLIRARFRVSEELARFVVETRVR
jgi:hypothetical protein